MSNNQCLAGRSVPLNSAMAGTQPGIMTHGSNATAYPLPIRMAVLEHNTGG
jgi:hypothetical protein